MIAIMENKILKTGNGDNTEIIQTVNISELKPYEQQPFKVLIDESMEEIMESVKQNGVLSPIIARPHREGGYEILSGHRRVKACELAGITELPVVVKNLDDDTAAILLVDSNLQRENILPSQKAFAYRLKLEAMKRQGERTDLTSAQFVPKLTAREQFAQEAGVNLMEITSYIRLTNLIDPLLEMVDEKKIALNAAVGLSYLGTKEQAEVLNSIEKEEASPSIAQAAKMRRFSQNGKLNPDVIDSIMQEQKPEKIKITLAGDKVKKYFPEDYTEKQIEDVMIKLLDDWYKKRQRKKEYER